MMWSTAVGTIIIVTVVCGIAIALSEADRASARMHILPPPTPGQPMAPMMLTPYTRWLGVPPNGISYCACGAQSDFICVDCVRNGLGAFHVCARPACRARHEAMAGCGSARPA
jgi:hypothetical protein